jgi:molybdopterin converting factor small subunit
MGVKIKLSLAFQELAGFKDKVEVNGSTVKQCLDDFIKRFPRTRNWLFDSNGSLQPLVLINGEALSQEQLNQRVTESDELWILNILEGG